MQMTLARLGKQSIKLPLVNQIHLLLTSFITKGGIAEAVTIFVSGIAVS